MRLGIIGAGGIGSALASLFVRHGQEVILGSRHPEAIGDLVTRIGASAAATYCKVIETCEVVCFCVPWEYSANALAQLGDLSGKILIDVSNPEAPDGRSLALGHSISGAELVAQRATGAKVVKAFNYIYAELLHDPTALSRLGPSIFLCSDHADAKDTVSSLITACGLDPVDCGPLCNARYLEPLALLMVQLVRERGWAPDRVAMKLARG